MDSLWENVYSRKTLHLDMDFHPEKKWHILKLQYGYHYTVILLNKEIYVTFYSVFELILVLTLKAPIATKDLSRLLFSSAEIFKNPL